MSTNLNATHTPGYGFATAAQPDSHPQNINDVGIDLDVNAFLYPHHSPKVAAELIATAHALVSPRGRGIYATDETPEGIEARLIAAFGEEGKGKTNWTEDEKREKRRRWRECLYESLPSEYISGVILHSETLIDFKLAPILEARGIIPGVRADTDSHPLPISPLEPATQGLDDLLPRLQAAKKAGARFTKWRAPILCNASTLPTQAALEAQAESLARFASISQQAGLVPIVEPDVDFSEDAPLKRSVEVHTKIIGMIYARCNAYGVLIEGSLIKPSFPQPGLKLQSVAPSNIAPETVAFATATALARTLPVGVAGVVFLSGGLSDKDSALYLSHINSLIDRARSITLAHTRSGNDGQSDTKTELGIAEATKLARLPNLTFSFGRGLQGDAMQRWVRGDEKGACEAFRERAKVCWESARGGVTVEV